MKNTIINPDDKQYYDNLYTISMYLGAGVDTIAFDVYANNEQQALEIAVADAEINRPNDLLDFDSVRDYVFVTFEDEYKDWLSDKSGEEYSYDESWFDFAQDYLGYIYVDATEYGASQPYFIEGNNIQIREADDEEKKEELLDVNVNKIDGVDNGSNVDISENKKVNEGLVNMDVKAGDIGSNNSYDLGGLGDIGSLLGEGKTITSADELPDMCYGVLPSDCSIIIIKKGVNGYFETNKDYEREYADIEDYAEKCKKADEICNRLNAEIDVTPEQRQSMEVRSMFGNWEDKKEEFLDLNINKVKDVSDSSIDIDESKNIKTEAYSKEELTDLLNKGEILQVGQTQFKMDNGDVAFKDPEFTGGGWEKHPNMKNTDNLVNHLDKLQQGSHKIKVVSAEKKAKTDEEMYEITKNTNVKEWYKDTFPEDKIGDEINPDITFYDVFEALDNYKDIYALLGVGDSTIRERVFYGLDDMLDEPNGYCYKQWLLSESKSVKTEVEQEDSEDLFIYSDANSYDKLEAEGNLYMFKQEAPNLKFRMRTEKMGNDTMYYIDFIGTKKDLKDYLTSLGWYTDTEVMGRIKPYKAEKQEGLLDVNVDTGDILSGNNLDLGGAGALLGLLGASEETRESEDKLEEYYVKPEDEHIIWDSEESIDDYDMDEVKEIYQDYVDNFDSEEKPMSFDSWIDSEWCSNYFEYEWEEAAKENERYEDWANFILDFVSDSEKQEGYEEYKEQCENTTLTPKDFESWFNDYRIDMGDDIWNWKETDLKENIFPVIDNQLNDNILIISGYYGSNYPDFNSSGEGGKLFEGGTDDFRAYMGDFDRVCITTQNGILGTICSDHDGTVSGQFYTLPDDRTELIKALGYEDIIKERYDEEDLDKYNHNDLMETEFNNDLYYGNLDSKDFTYHLELLKPIKDTISAYTPNEPKGTKTENKEVKTESADDEIIKLSAEELNEYVTDWVDGTKSKLDNKKYMAKDGNKYVAVDNTSGDCYVEEFDTENEALNYLEGLEYGDDILENMWTAVCSDDKNYVKNAYNKQIFTPNTRYHKFGNDISLIMGALRNENYDMVELLKSFGETIRKNEVAEYKNIMSRRVYEDDITKSAKDESKEVKTEAIGKDEPHYLVGEYNANGNVDYIAQAYNIDYLKNYAKEHAKEINSKNYNRVYIRERGWTGVNSDKDIAVDLTENKEVKTEAYEFTPLKKTLYNKIIDGWADDFLNKDTYNWKIDDKVILKDIIKNGLSEDDVSEMLDEIAEEENKEYGWGINPGDVKDWGIRAIYGAGYGDLIDELDNNTPLDNKIMEKAHKILGIKEEGKKLKKEAEQINIDNCEVDDLVEAAEDLGEGSSTTESYSYTDLLFNIFRKCEDYVCYDIKVGYEKEDGEIINIDEAVVSKRELRDFFINSIRKANEVLDELNESKLSVKESKNSVTNMTDSINEAESFNELLDLLDKANIDDLAKLQKARNLVSHTYTHISDEEEKDTLDNIKEQVIDILTEAKSLNEDIESDRDLYMAVEYIADDICGMDTETDATFDYDNDLMFSVYRDKGNTFDIAAFYKGNELDDYNFVDVDMSDVDTTLVNIIKGIYNESGDTNLTTTEYVITFEDGDLYDKYKGEFTSEDKAEADALFDEIKSENKLDQVSQYYAKTWIKTGNDFVEDDVEVYYTK